MLYSIKIVWRQRGCYVTWNGQPFTCLQQKGWTNVQIAEFTGHHRDTIARVLREEVEKKPKTRQRASRVAIFDDQIREWLDQNVPVSRMLELARAESEHPYTGGETADLTTPCAKCAAHGNRHHGTWPCVLKASLGNTCRSIGERCVTWRSAKRRWSTKRVTSLQPGSNTVATCM
jgi:hypothetical protein